MLITGSYGECFPFQLPPGSYKLLFEARFLTDEEMKSAGTYDDLLKEIEDPSIEFWDELRPELCIFTFISTADEVEPKILKGFEPKQELVLHRKSRPPGYD